MMLFSETIPFLDCRPWLRLSKNVALVLETHSTLLRMDDALPSYETAITKDHWKIVAGYIPSRDLCNAALVCQKWHEIFAPQLWGNPASHFGAQNDTVYGTEVT